MDTIYIVSDMRTVPDTATGGWAVITTTTQHHTRNGAEERFHTALASAARSEQYPCWSAVLMTNEGFVLEHRAYLHDVAPAPEPEPESSEE